MIDKRFKHGLVPRHNKPPEFGVWCKIRNRCNNPKNKDYPNYGGRGISVCERWANDFAAFLHDMGPRPNPSLSIERLNNDGNYEPSNCIWADRKTQNNNRRAPKTLTHCRRGHQLAGDNLYSRPDGKRGCKECRRMNMRDFYARAKGHTHV